MQSMFDKVNLFREVPFEAREMVVQSYVKSGLLKQNGTTFRLTTAGLLEYARVLTEACNDFLNESPDGRVFAVCNGQEENFYTFMGAEIAKELASQGVSPEEALMAYQCFAQVDDSAVAV